VLAQKKLWIVYGVVVNSGTCYKMILVAVLVDKRKVCSSFFPGTMMSPAVFYCTLDKIATKVYSLSSKCCVA